MPLNSVKFCALAQPTLIHQVNNSLTVHSQSGGFMFHSYVFSKMIFFSITTAGLKASFTTEGTQLAKHEEQSPSMHCLGVLWVTCCLSDRHTCCDTVRCKDWWRGEWAGLAGALQGLCPVEGKNRNWLPFGWEAAFYSPCALRLTSRCASEQYLQKKKLKKNAKVKMI